MTYSPGSAGYPPSQGPGSYGAPAQFGPPADPGPSKLPLYLTAAVVALGLIAYLASFGPMFTLSSDLGPFGGDASFGASGTSVLVVVGASLLAAVGLLPKAKNYHAIVAVLAVLGLLLTITQLIGKPDGFAIGWAFWVFLAAVLFQTVAAVGALLLDSGVITPPAPRPKYEQQQFGQYGPPGGYYGGAPNQPGQPGQDQRPGYPSQYGGYPQGPAAGGFGGQQQHAAQQGPPTPPTGYPSFSPPPAVGPGGPVSPSAPTQQAQTPPPSGGPATS